MRRPTFHDAGDFRSIPRPRCVLRLIALAALVCWFAMRDGSLCSAQNQANQDFGVTVQLPSLGVEIDAAGLLKLSVTDPTGSIRAERAAAARRTLNADVQRASASRKISLRRLAEAISRTMNSGQELDPIVSHLAGLWRLDHVFLCPDDRDIIIAGPAGGWFEEPSGRIVCLEQRQPLIMLDDWLTALRAFGPHEQLNKVILCSIDPTPEGLDRYKKLKRDIPMRFTDAEWAALPARMIVAMREALGDATVRVYGVADSSHIGQVMVECDYRMKMIGVGLEPEPTPLVTFIEAIDRPIGGFQQWWLRPKYERLIQDADALALNIVGQSIELVTGRLEATADDRLVVAEGRPSAAAKKYAGEFTEKYALIAERCPVFAQLQTISDLLVVSAWLKKSDAWLRIGWDGGVLFDAGRLPEKTLPVAKTAQCVANAVTKGNMLFTPVGGGFSITPAIALDAEHLKIDRQSDQFRKRRGELAIPHDEHQWWWD